MKRAVKISLGVLVVLHVPALCRAIETVVAIRNSASFSSSEAAQMLKKLFEELEEE